MSVSKKLVAGLTFVLLAIPAVTAVHVYMFSEEKVEFFDGTAQVQGYSTYWKTGTRSIVLKNEADGQLMGLAIPARCKEFPRNKIINISYRKSTRNILFWDVISYYVYKGGCAS